MVISATPTTEMDEIKPVMWMQSDHLNKLVTKQCGSQAMLARVSDHKLQSDYQPLYDYAALAAARIAGMRESVAMLRAEILRLRMIGTYEDDADYLESLASNINRAIEEKAT